MVHELIQQYLDPAHVDQSQSPCPLAFLVTDVANREADVRSTYGKAFKKAATPLDAQMAEDFADSRNRSLALLAMMIGGVAIARAVDDKASNNHCLRLAMQSGVRWLNDCMPIWLQ
ncbi:hypothetical protein [Mariprofundus erugo]|uniref:hypothetical protein n=1 Tax=Mariprofundus erugo TaxID=2528639 RepID=UPI0013A54054|nr:hypothetical protein [Mariprofundus erugo]